MKGNKGRKIRKSQGKLKKTQKIDENRQKMK